MARIDLHTHSDRSDGQLPPDQVVRLAAEAGLAAVALTDHDTVDGLLPALEAGRAHGIEVVPGCELSVTDSGRELHLLGLFVDPDCPGLAGVLDSLRRRRHDRNRGILDKLNVQGIRIDYDQVLAQTRGSVGRPHIAHVLMERGLVDSQRQAFSRYLGRSGRAYVPKDSMNLTQAVAAIHQARGSVFLAHPCLLGLKGQALTDLLRNLAGQGVDGIEAYYPDQSPSLTRFLLETARNLGLMVSGGSDFHGDIKPGLRLGVGRGELDVPLSVLDDIKAARLAKGLPVAPAEAPLQARGLPVAPR